MKQVNPEMYDEFANTIAVIIAENNETVKRRSKSFDERIEKLNEVQRGWVNAFRMASIHGKLKELDGWLRNRLRYCIWSRVLGRRSPNGKGKT